MNADQTVTRQGDLITGLRPVPQVLASIGEVGFAGFPNDYAYLPVSLENVMTIFAC